MDTHTDTDILEGMDLMKDGEKRTERRRIMKNIVVVSLAFLLHTTAFGGLSRLQSSLHKDDGIGVITQAIMYAFFAFSCLFLSKMIIRLLGYKWTMPVMMMGFLLWDAANGYGVWATMVPASIIVGICSAPLWASQATYFKKQAVRYAYLSAQDKSTVVTKFAAIFTTLYQSENIIGAIISSTILRPKTVNGTEVTPSDEDLQLCGRNDCPGNNVTNPHLEKQDPYTVWIMLGIYMAVSVAGIALLAIFVDSLPRQNQTQEANTRKGFSQFCASNINQFGGVRQLLIIPLTVLSGMETGFIWADFTKSYVTCSIGIRNVGLVNIPFGITCAATSIGINALAKYTTRISLFTVYVVLRLGLYIFLLLWIPHPETAYLLYIVSGVTGATRAVQNIFFYSLCSSSLFSEDTEGAFCNYKMWQSLGYIITFSISPFLCTSVKLYILLSVMGIGTVSYGVLEHVMGVSKGQLDIPVQLKRPIL